LKAIGGESRRRSVAVTLFGQEPDVPVRGKHYIRPDGYADVPGKGPAGQTCRTCRFLTRVGRSRRYPKCELARAGWSSTRRTDVLVNSPACRLWQAVVGSAIVV